MYQRLVSNTWMPMYEQVLRMITINISFPEWGQAANLPMQLNTFTQLSVSGTFHCVLALIFPLHFLLCSLNIQFYQSTTFPCILCFYCFSYFGVRTVWYNLFPDVNFHVTESSGSFLPDSAAHRCPQMPLPNYITSKYLYGNLNIWVVLFVSGFEKCHSKYNEHTQDNGCGSCSTAAKSWNDNKPLQCSTLIIYY